MKPVIQKDKSYKNLLTKIGVAYQQHKDRAISAVENAEQLANHPFFR